MEGSTPARVLIVAHRTAAASPLVDRVRERASQGPCEFSLLVPHAPRGADPEGEEAERTLELALPLLEEAVGAEVAGAVGDSDPVKAVRETVRNNDFDEVIISTLPEHVSRWLKREVPRRVQELGLHVTVVTAPQGESIAPGQGSPALRRQRVGPATTRARPLSRTGSLAPRYAAILRRVAYPPQTGHGLVPLCSSSICARWSCSAGLASAGLPLPPTLSQVLWSNW